MIGQFIAIQRIQNSTNCPGMRLVPSQIKVLLLAP